MSSSIAALSLRASPPPPPAPSVPLTKRQLPLKAVKPLVHSDAISPDGDHLLSLGKRRVNFSAETAILSTPDGDASQLTHPQTPVKIKPAIKKLDPKESEPFLSQANGKRPQYVLPYSCLAHSQGIFLETRRLPFQSPTLSRLRGRD